MMERTDNEGINLFFEKLIQYFENVPANQSNSQQQVFSYLKLLLYFLNKGVDSQIILSQLCARDNCCFIPNAMQSSAKNVKILFQLLHELLNQGIRLEKLMSALNMCDRIGNNLGNSLACYQNDELNEYYISFLLHLYRRGMSAEIILAVLKHQDVQGMSYGAWIVKNNLMHSVERYFQLLKLFLDDGINLQDVQHLMKLRGKISTQEQAKDIFDYLVEQQQVILIFKAFTYGLVPQTAFPQLKKIKPLILDYIQKINNLFFKKNILRDALDITLPLGQFFNDFYIYSRAVRELKATLNALESADKIRWSAEFFPHAKPCEFETYIYLIDPSNPKLKY